MYASVASCKDIVLSVSSALNVSLAGRISRSFAVGGSSRTARSAGMTGGSAVGRPSATSGVDVFVDVDIYISLASARPVIEAVVPEFVADG